RMRSGKRLSTVSGADTRKHFWWTARDEAHELSRSGGLHQLAFFHRQKSLLFHGASNPECWVEHICATKFRIHNQNLKNAFRVSSLRKRRSYCYADRDTATFRRGHRQR